MSRAPVVISKYDARWPGRAAALITELRVALGPDALRIDHIGSTAIPGMDAKDVLDLQVSVTDLDLAAQRFDAPLARMGFERSVHARDHVPAGRVDDPVSWAKRFWSRRDHADGDVNLHVRVVGSPNERVALLFRDWMRAHPEALAPYGAFKRSLATQAPDSEWYSDVKDPVVDLVIAVAEPWASATGWSTGTTADQP
jgi:GrpB-like predicted nucleotidyltransferase (UPF0157 family)